MLEETFVRFKELLNTRFSKGVYTTEDSVRYTFYAALTVTESIDPHNVILELPHEAIEGAEVDTYFLGDDRHECVIEFKYHRQIPSGGNSPRTQKAGDLFKDLSRLARFEPRDAANEITRLLVYVTDEEMSKYLLRERNNLQCFYDLPLGEELTIIHQFFADRSDTFVMRCGDVPELTIKMEFMSDLPGEHYLRIWSVSPL